MALNKITIERNQKILLDLVAQPGNDVCADCKVKNPRWASHSLGIFICVSCASVHRKIGTHVTKVKSLTMDSWTKEQTENMKNNGNIKSNLFYNPNETRHPPPP
ncbi:ArfGap-domain-containing protein [Mycena venus]|uniref:ArfGap-domain-containing protein n=1 Tax=Mycena venus TaxID=2733690 RepID=A0A8H6XN19_9AGAR|nr:ArfGap-domain-containing protein [Mycena venus]